MYSFEFLLAAVCLATSGHAFLHPGAVLRPNGRGLAASHVNPHPRASVSNGYCGVPLRTRHLVRGLGAVDESSTGEGTTADESLAAEEVDGDAEMKQVTPADLGFSPVRDRSAGRIETTSAPAYPIDLPAYLLLSLSTVLAIAFVGCIFEATSAPTPQLGYPLTYLIGILSLPSFLFLFYAAIKKGQAEAEEEDESFR